jgi:putative oxidoreductase
MKALEEWDRMNIVLWIAQGLLAIAYVLAGSMKAFRPVEQLSKNMKWVTAVPAGLVRFIGIAEVVGGIGLIIPMVTNIAPGLTVAAAAGLVLVQVCAIVFHVSRGEARGLPANLVLLLLALLVLVGRVAIVPIG